MTPHPLSSGHPPAWASAWGQDRYGPWVEFAIPSGAGGRVAQRMRWIPAGRFQMGSPESEEGRRDNEGPVHEVLLSRGYWLFDTPCTQELWEAVMGANPSQFSGPRRPVEQVSWEDVGQFLERVNKTVSGLELGLPTEAEWEYACRAGTAGARYGELDEVAWYRENSGRETHDVGTKDANGWGLYDMLGNVWEWCGDGMRKYAADRMIDPVGARDSAAARVVRGGSWFDFARLVRAAFRLTNEPGHRDGHLGFRCLSSGR